MNDNFKYKFCVFRFKMNDQHQQGRCDFLAIDLYPWIENPLIFELL
jgi:hypothetical protein